MESSGNGNSFEDSLPPGFRFHPTDEELVVHYLRNKLSSAPLPVQIIAEIDLYKFDPWDLPEKAEFGKQEWYFFSPRDRKYPNGARPNRAAASGYWKATGTDKPILASGTTHKVGVKKALVFYKGKPPKGTKTNWIMHEYRLVDAPTRIKGSLRLDDWVLCRIYKKTTGHATRAEECVEEVLASLPDIDMNQHDDGVNQSQLSRCLLEAEDPKLLETLLVDQDATSAEAEHCLKRNTDTLDELYPPAKRNNYVQPEGPSLNYQKLFSDFQQIYRYPFAENRLWN